MIFISHRKQDEQKARQMAAYLSDSNVDSYLDVLDPSAKNATDITKHIMKNLGACTHVIVIFSSNTAGSMWVPFELGAAYLDGKGIGTFLTEWLETPEYLNTFPKMRTSADVDQFIVEYKESQRLEKSAVRNSRSDSFNLSESARQQKAQVFIDRLKSRLGQ
jgi:hypothetical protein